MEGWVYGHTLVVQALQQNIKKWTFIAFTNIGEQVFLMNTVILQIISEQAVN